MTCRDAEAKDPSLSGHRETVDAMTIPAIATDTPIQFSHCRYPALLKEGKFQTDYFKLLISTLISRNRQLSITNQSLLHFALKKKIDLNLGIWKSVRRLWPRPIVRVDRTWIDLSPRSIWTAH